MDSCTRKILIQDFFVDIGIFVKEEVIKLLEITMIVKTIKDKKIQNKVAFLLLSGLTYALSVTENFKYDALETNLSSNLFWCFTKQPL